MRHVRSRLCLSTTLSLLAAHYAFGDTLRCGNKLIQSGDSIVTVKALCGAPASVENGVAEIGTNEVPAETWTYNRGPDQFMVSIRFVDGKVVAVTTLHQYGY